MNCPPMRPGVIRKTDRDLPVPAHLADWASTCASFSWQQVRDELAGADAGVLNIAQLAVDRHAQGPHAQRCALRFLRAGGGVSEIDFAELKSLTDRFANVLRALGVGEGERVFVLAGRIPELYVAVLGALKHGSVVSPLFSAFGPEPIATRVNIGAGTRAGHHRGALPAQGREDAREHADAAACAARSARAAPPPACPARSISRR